MDLLSKLAYISTSEGSRELSCLISEQAELTTTFKVRHTPIKSLRCVLTFPTYTWHAFATHHTFAIYTATHFPYSGEQKYVRCTYIMGKSYKCTLGLFPLLHTYRLTYIQVNIHTG